MGSVRPRALARERGSIPRRGVMTDRDYERFERLLKESSRRDFLRGMGAAAALAAFGAGGVEALEA
jgi:hypothetical protein